MNNIVKKIVMQTLQHTMLFQMIAIVILAMLLFRYRPYHQTINVLQFVKTLRPHKLGTFVVVKRVGKIRQ